VNEAAGHSAVPPVHAKPYRFIDAVERYAPGEGITCTATIRTDEPYFAGHFPGQPIVPGVFCIEMLFQAAELCLILETGTGRNGSMRPGAVASARFTSPIVPPREVTVTVNLREDRGSDKIFSGRLSDGRDTFVQALFSVTV
jgi:3-hydroxyacyl-[acyl-carrier-protein] dehydratase